MDDWFKLKPFYLRVQLYRVITIRTSTYSIITILIRIIQIVLLIGVKKNETYLFFYENELCLDHF